MAEPSEPTVRHVVSSRLERARALVLGVMVTAALSGCGQPDGGTWALSPIEHELVVPSRFADGRVVAEGVRVSAADLDEGRMAYVDFCASCHGLDGDGRGYAAKGLDPAPRDFRAASFKFAAVRAGELPADADLVRMIQRGSTGTAMPAWGLPDDVALRIAQFLKTFAPDRWLGLHATGPKAGTPRARVGEPVHLPVDPWPGREVEAVRAGEVVYHLVAQCSTCHPSYLDADELVALSERAGMGTPPSPREHLHEPVPLAADKNPYGVAVVPPDFTRDTLRSVRPAHRIADVAGVVASGVGGIMPSWIDALDAERLWAVAYYVDAKARLPP